MALSISAVNRTEVPEDGGYPIDIVGDFSEVLGQDLEVYIGTNGDATDTPCYSGVPGSSRTVIPLSDTLLRCYTPRLDTGLQSIFVQTVDTLSQDLLTDSIMVFKRGFETSVFDMRRVLPPWYRTGPRTIDEEDF